MTLFCALVLVTSAVTFLALRGPAMYRATAVLRLAGERRAVAATMDQELPVPVRTATATASLVPLIRSRTLVGAVVDSLQLQIRSVPGNWRWPFSSDRSVAETGVRVLQVDPSAEWDTVQVRFLSSHLLVRQEGRWEEKPYGAVVQDRWITFEVPSRPTVEKVVLEVLPRDRAIDLILGELAAVPLPETDAIEVKFTHADPRRAQQIVNLIAQTFQTANVRSSQELGKRRRQFFSDRLKEIDSLLGQAQANLTKFRSQRRLANSADELASQQAARAALDSRRDELDANRRVYQSLLAQLQPRGDTASIEGLRNLAYSPEIATDPVVGRLYQQVLQYRSRLDSLTSGPWRSSETNPDVMQARDLLRSSRGELVRAVRGHLTSLDERSELLAGLRSSNAAQIQALPALQAEEKGLEQHVAALDRHADGLRLEYQKARMSEELAAGDIEIVDLAALPYRPVGVPWWLKLALSGLLGLFIGVVGSVLKEAWNRSIRGPEELEHLLQIPGLAVIPQVSGAHPVGWAKLRRRLAKGGATGFSNEIVADSRSPSESGEAFRLLYSSLTSGWRNANSTRTVLVTSVAPQEGKTLIAANLAVTFAREGARVLLVDCDLRRPRLHRLFQMPAAPGLTNLMGVVRPPIQQQGSEEPGLSTDEPVSTQRSYSMFPGVERAAQDETMDSPPQPWDVLAAHASPSGQGTAPDLSASPQAGYGRHSSPRGEGGAANAMSPSPGYSEVRRTSIEGLYLLSCGDLPANPAEALKLANVRAVLEELSRDFHVIVLDTPPVLVSADAAILAPLAGDVLMVIRSGQTDREAASLAFQQLAASGAPILGAVLNDPEGHVARQRRLHYSYDYASDPD